MSEDSVSVKPATSQEDQDQGLGCLVMVVLAIFAFLVSNAWYCEDSAVQALKSQYPDITYVYSVDRNVFQASIFEAEKDNVKVKFCLDTNILFDYEFTECDTESDFDYRDWGY